MPRTANRNQWGVPIQDMLTLREAMSQLFEDSVVRMPNGGRRGEEVAVPMDISEGENSFFIELVAPGLKAGDINITVENNTLTIGGEFRPNEGAEQRTYHRNERRYGAFHRSLTLPNTVRADQINASLQDGILKLEIPKAEEVKPRQININVQSN